MDFDQDGQIGVNELRAFLRGYDPEESPMMRSKSALIVVDVQNDFITGTLANPYKAAEIVPKINQVREKVATVVISYDYHPDPHCSFVESVNEGKVAMKESLDEPFGPFSTVTLTADEDRPEHQQMIYPRHAVQ